MCGRYAQYRDAGQLAMYFDAEVPVELQPNYNVSPSQTVPIVRQETAGRRFALARWGLVPAWAKDLKLGYSTFNARAETVASKPAFRSAFRYRRCLVPADGFYEWQALPESKRKQPWFIARQDRGPLAFAGLWERWTSPAGDILESCTIVVTDANALMRPIHERMPVILLPAHWDAWLAPDGQDPAALQALLQPYPADDLAAWPVARVGDPGIKDLE
jgi:putative SOS response-associated peptidase YedK